MQQLKAYTEGFRRKDYDIQLTDTNMIFNHSEFRNYHVEETGALVGVLIGINFSRSFPFGVESILITAAATAVCFGIGVLLDRAVKAADKKKTKKPADNLTYNFNDVKKIVLCKELFDSQLSLTVSGKTKTFYLSTVDYKIVSKWLLDVPALAFKITVY